DLHAISSAYAHAVATTHPVGAGGRAVRAASERVATAVADGSTVVISARGRADERSTEGRRPLADAVGPTGPSRRAIVPTVQRPAAIVPHGTAVMVSARSLAGDFRAHTGRPYAQVILTHPSGLQTIRRTVQHATASVPHLATVASPAWRVACGGQSADGRRRLADAVGPTGPSRRAIISAC